MKMVLGLQLSLALVVSIGFILPSNGYSVALTEGSGWDEASAGFDEG